MERGGKTLENIKWQKKKRIPTKVIIRNVNGKIVLCFYDRKKSHQVMVKNCEIRKKEKEVLRITEKNWSLEKFD